MSKGTPDIVFFLFTERLGGLVAKCEEGTHSQESSFLRGGFAFVVGAEMSHI